MTENRSALQPLYGLTKTEKFRFLIIVLEYGWLVLTSGGKVGLSV